MKEKQKPAKVKKGAVIARKHNRTVDTSRAQHNPKWENMLDANERPTGVRVLKGPGNKRAFIGWKDGKMASLKRTEVVARLLAPEAEAIEASA